ncbi:MAG: flagellar biosynthetic protein FliO, partial [Deltaproteobacteria bacterium]|nr:flagellar biosynthetic protein FliO [Deltaproteobacteria bacterium]
MSPLLFLASMAIAQDADYNRLFGAEAAPASASAPAELPASGWAWPALLAGAGVAAAWQLRKKVHANAAQVGMRVVQREVVGDKSSLILVEVDDGKGNARRLLLGSSPGGVALVQDLGANEAAEVEAQVMATAAPAPMVEAAPEEPAAAPVARARVDAFARVLDGVMEERSRENAAPTSEFDENAFFASRPAQNAGRFFTEEDLAPLATAAPEAPPRELRPIAPVVPSPVALVPRPLPTPAPRTSRAASAPVLPAADAP